MFLNMLRMFFLEFWINHFLIWSSSYIFPQVIFGKNRKAFVVYFDRHLGAALIQTLMKSAQSCHNSLLPIFWSILLLSTNLLPTFPFSPISVPGYSSTVSSSYSYFTLFFPLLVKGGGLGEDLNHSQHYTQQCKILRQS